MTATPSEVVLAYLASWHDLDPERTAAFCAPDVVYESMPRRAVHEGRAAIAEIVGRFAASAADMHAEIRTVAVAQDGAVMVERRDTFTVDGNPVEMCVASVATVEDGLITSWREYWDEKSMYAQAAGGASEG